MVTRIAITAAVITAIRNPNTTMEKAGGIIDL
jgi:hypothetical protein